MRRMTTTLVSAAVFVVPPAGAITSVGRSWFAAGTGDFAAAADPSHATKALVSTISRMAGN
jgi:hypothetical protein